MTTVPKIADIAALIGELEAIGDDLEQIDKLATLATDRAATENERRTAAVEACIRLRRANVFAKARQALTWIRDNRSRFEALQKGAAFLQSLRGGK